MAATKTDLARAGTMQVTAKEGEAFLENKTKVDDDAQTRGQQKKIEEISAPPAKKPKAAPRERKGPQMKHVSTIDKTIAEAKAIGINVDVSEGRKTRSGGKPSLGRAGTMATTAKEGKAFLKKTAKKAAPKKAAKEDKPAVEPAKGDAPETTATA